MKKTYCEHCNKIVEFYTKENQTIYDDLLNVNFIGTICLCKECNNEVHTNEIDAINLKIANEEYEKSLISVDDIKALLKKYSIGATVLSNILGWGDVTITRYKKGSKPSIKYSNKLKELLCDPYKMYELLINSKDNMTSIAYEKALKATIDEIEKLHTNENNKSIVNALNYTNNKLTYNIDLISKYILSKVSVTPKALQKLLYYCQGFYYSFFNTWLFPDIPQAWRHGPVYPNIYYTYKNYGYNPIIISNINIKEIEQQLSDSTIIFLNTLIKYYSCYTGDILEYISHNELPWINARVGLKDSDSSQNQMNLDDIAYYFKSIKDKYNIINFSDTKDYITDMIFCRIQN